MFEHRKIMENFHSGFLMANTAIDGTDGRRMGMFFAAGEPVFPPTAAIWVATIESLLLDAGLPLDSLGRMRS